MKNILKSTFSLTLFLIYHNSYGIDQYEQKINQLLDHGFISKEEKHDYLKNYYLQSDKKIETKVLNNIHFSLKDQKKNLPSRSIASEKQN
jgi:hypothetical protein